ncbi:MAG: ComF family protein [Gammaproteobacteria bacterium]|nr:ComF family protein [Gammaproteobacteria bacterium]MCP5459122.1 ComF family protein [Gammaproteobacteria bacterium]
MTISDQVHAVNRSALDRVYQWSKKLQLRCFPATCLLCGAPGEGDRDLCVACQRDLPQNRSACPCCATPLVNATEARCGQCQRQPPVFARSVAPWLYREPLDYLIKSLKFQGRLSVARLLGDLLGGELVRRDCPRPQAIIPVPLHASRMRERGFNQALELARPLARKLELPLLAAAVKRVRPTPPQMQLDAASRRGNVRGAFIVARALSLRHVAVLDDVMTTGSTVTEVARVLRTAGVEEISIWACGRTPY